MSKVSSQLSDLYDGYYRAGGAEDVERTLAGKDSVDAIVRLGGSRLGRTLDVGAGNGVVSAEIDRRGLASEIVALEISKSGVEKIRERKLPSLSAALLFDGYSFPLESGSFDSVVCAHVIEHVEHERLFLKEIARVGRRLYLVAPLEGGARGRIYRDMGHINYYSPLTLANLVETSGFRILGQRIYPSSTAYERQISGYAIGTMKSLIRKSVGLLFGRRAPHLMAFVMAIAAEPVD